jgi:hypothetical protein
MFAGSAGLKPLASARCCIDSTEVNPASIVSWSEFARWSSISYAGHHGYCYQPKQKKADPLALYPPVGLTNLLDNLRDIFHD